MAENKKTPVFNWLAGEFATDLQGRVILATEEKAVEQVIIKAQETPRGTYLIYADTENPDLNHKYGSDVHDIAVRQDLSEEVRISEIKRTVKEAVIYDPWVLDVTEITVYKQRDTDGIIKDFVDYKVKTVYDNEILIKGAVLNA